MRFRDRIHAGEMLAQQLAGRAWVNPIVLGIPRGGVEVAWPIARALNAALNVVLVRKLRCSTQPELAIGAIDESGRFTLNPNAAFEPPGAVESERVLQLDEIRRRRALLGTTGPRPTLQGRSVILTDDGVATGATFLAALTLLCAQDPHTLIAAIPVAPADRLGLLGEGCDELLCLHAPALFVAVGAFYDEFAPVSDERVSELLALGKQYTERREAGGSP
ncbi:MAG: phosphoribosyltransferase [Phycisphaerales bacterium]|nr:phosphoribosyltransferase [Phycisphaerales bacterium]